MTINDLNNTFSIKPSDIYFDGISRNLKIPKGYNVVGFRIPLGGDVVLGITESRENPGYFFYYVHTDHISKKENRLILKKVEPLDLNTILYQVPATIVYKNVENLYLPEGYSYVGFRPPKKGEFFIAYDKNSRVIDTIYNYHELDPRIIVEKEENNQ